ncbi:hypothetical protein ACHAPE_003801 [Trichoderma viride]
MRRGERAETSTTLDWPSPRPLSPSSSVLDVDNSAGEKAIGTLPLLAVATSTGKSKRGSKQAVFCAFAVPRHAASTSRCMLVRANSSLARTSTTQGGSWNMNRGGVGGQGFGIPLKQPDRAWG